MDETKQYIIDLINTVTNEETLKNIYKFLKGYLKVWNI